MSTDDTERIHLAKLELRDRSLAARFAIGERSKSHLELLAYDHSTEEMFLGCLDKHQFVAFKDLTTDSEVILAKLTACEVLMPSDTVANPMSLRVEVGSLELQNAGVGFSLSIDRTRAAEVVLSCSDGETNGLVLVRLGKTDFRRFRDWINEVELQLAELFKSGYITKPFAG